MNIVLVSPYPSNSLQIDGGVAGVSYYLTNAICDIDANIKLSVVIPAYSGGYRTSTIGRITVNYLPVGTCLPALFANATSFRWRLFRLLRKLRPDIVHFQGLATWGLNCPLPAVLTVHGIPENDLLFSSKRFIRAQRYVMKLFEFIARRQVRDVILISPFVSKELAGHFTGKEHHICNPVAEKYFSIERINEKPVIFFGGFVGRRKNVLGLLKAFRLVSAAIPDAVLRIAGSLNDAQYVEECRLYLKLNFLEDKVVFLGQLRIPQIESEFSTASVVALFSEKETAPLVISEAMAAGVPVVTSRAGGLPYMVRHGVNGFLIDPEKPEVASEYLIALLQNKDLNSTMGAAAQAYAAENFHPKAVARKTLEVYRARLSENK